MGLVARFEQHRQENEDNIRADIIRHLIALLASRRPVWGKPLESDDLRNSIAGLGLTDPPRRIADWQGRLLADDVSDLLQRFEHRLCNIRVDVIGDNHSSNRIQLHIEANLAGSLAMLQAGEYAVMFDTRIELSAF